MVGIAEAENELKKLNVSVVAASVDAHDKAQEVADELNFPIGHGVTRDDADKLGSWWEERRQIIQPSEFILDANNVVLASSYSDGPLARMLAPDLVGYLTFVDAQKRK